MGYKSSNGTRETTWGASVNDGGTRFRLWAPAERKVDLLLGNRTHAMTPVEDGWFELETNRAGPGDPYTFRLTDGMEIADPAARAQVDGVDGRSLVVDHRTFDWSARNWRGRPWEETVLYELHIGTFTPEGTFHAAIGKLPHLRDIGVTAIEIMPVAHFAGRRGWGYDGVLHFAPHPVYGAPDDLKALVDAAHRLGLSVLLDVVYNHFGPVGNYLPRIAPTFFKDRQTPWGAAIAFEQPAVRRYFLENALQWICDYRFDGLRLDATEQIEDESGHHFLFELAEELRSAAGERHLHLVVEDQFSRQSLLRRDGNRASRYTAGWNDDFHHALHVIGTGETKGHYAPFGKAPYRILAKAAAEGFATADPAKDLLGPKPDTALPPLVNVGFLQNHDQVGNRGFGERKSVLTDSALFDCMTAFLMLVPHVPMLFMGEEYGETRPFHFFADFADELARATRNGRKAEAESFGGMPRGRTVDDLPDPIAERTFLASKLDWSQTATPQGRARIAFMGALAECRRAHVTPLLAAGGPVSSRILPSEDGIIAIDWQFGDTALRIRANFSESTKPSVAAEGRIVHVYPDGLSEQDIRQTLPAASLLVTVDSGSG